MKALSGGNPQPYGLCEFGHQGLMHDEESGLVHNRARVLSPALRRFLQRDPLGYVDGMGLYEYVESAPTTRGDPNGAIVNPIGAVYRFNHLDLNMSDGDFDKLRRILGAGSLQYVIEQAYAGASFHYQIFLKTGNSDEKRWAEMWAERYDQAVNAVKSKDCPNSALRLCRRGIRNQPPLPQHMAGLLPQSRSRAEELQWPYHVYVDFGKQISIGRRSYIGWGLPGRPHKALWPGVGETWGAGDVDLGCSPCTRNGKVLLWGSAAGKSSLRATDDEIIDCITKVPAAKDYQSGWYDCRHFAKDMVMQCGLGCDLGRLVPRVSGTAAPAQE